MKKQIVASLAAAMVLSIAGTSFAAANPFVDVPAKHWAYDSVTKLAQAGIVDGYSDGKYQGDKVMSRYEMAQIVAKAMARSDKADASQKAIIDKLSVEFASELEGLNVRVTKLEKNASSIKVSGEARLRYENKNAENKANENIGGSSMKFRTRVHLNGQINDQWGYYGRLQAINSLRDGNKDTNTTMDNAYVKGNLFGTTATVGRFDYFLNNGMMIDSTLNGAQLEFGNVLKARVFYGTDNNDDNFGQASGNQNLEVTGLGLNYATSKATSLNGGYYIYKDKDAVAGDEDKVKVWEAGFATQLATNLTLQGSYGKSDVDMLNADDENTAYFAELKYKGAKKANVGSFGTWVNYRHLEANAAPRTTFDGAYTAFGQPDNGAKGYEVGFDYTPMLNTVIRVKYADLKTISGSDDSKTKFIQAQAQFYF